MNGALAKAAVALCFVASPALAQAPAPTGTASPPAAAPAQPAPAPPAPAPPAPARPAPTTPQPAPPTGLPPGYYVEGETPPDSTAPDAVAPPAPAPPVGRAPPVPPPGYLILEPPPPGFGPLIEPPPPPAPRHVAPETALWTGVRIGWFVPFGNLYAKALPPDRYGLVYYDSVEWRDYATTGLALELDAGVRLSRNYQVFALWERAQLGGGHAESELHEQTSADSDFWALGLRATTNADTIGLVTEMALGYRQARTHFDDGGAFEFTDGWFEARLGIGADIRINEWFSLSPLATIGVGSFGSVHRTLGDGTGYDGAGPLDASDSHGWFTLTLGGHVDLFPAK